MGERESTTGLIGLLAVGVGVCCGLPVLASIGVLGGVARLGVGSWVLVATGLTVAGTGFWRWRQRARTRCDSPVGIERSEERVDGRAV